MKKLAIAMLALMLAIDAEAGAGHAAKHHPVATGLAVFAIGAVGYETIRRECINPNGTIKEQCRPADNTDMDSPELGKPSDLGILKSSHTVELRRNLNRDQISAGMPPDPDDCDAHHIVPKKEGRKWARGAADDARAILEMCNIDIDSEQNGIYLPNKNNGSSDCRGSYHKTLHKKKYYEEIRGRLTKASGVDCNTVADELAAIKNDLLLGRF